METSFPNTVAIPHNIHFCDFFLGKCEQMSISCRYSSDGRVRKWLYPHLAEWNSECIGILWDVYVRSYFQEQRWLKGSCVHEKPITALVATLESCFPGAQAWQKCLDTQAILKFMRKERKKVKLLSRWDRMEDEEVTPQMWPGESRITQDKLSTSCGSWNSWHEEVHCKVISGRN